MRNASDAAVPSPRVGPRARVGDGRPLPLRGTAATQNRDGQADFRAHLAGRIAHVAPFDHARGLKLRVAFDRVVWE
jgi:hypothetical protein